jgi:general secretion pathway protein D
MKIAIIINLFLIFLFGADCSNKLFNLKAYSKGEQAIRIKDILVDLSNNCDISVVFEDREAKRKIYSSLDFINIKNYTLNELLEFLLGENNLFYSYEPERKLLRLSYYKTKNFTIDYLNLSSMVSESKKSIALGAQGGSTTSGSSYNQNTGTNTGGSGSGVATDYTTITTTSEFTFWKSLQKQLESLLKSEKQGNYSLFINKDASLITVTGTKKQLEKVERFLNKLTDRMHKQVLIEAKLVEVSYNDSQTKGIDWSKFNLSIIGNRDATTMRQDGVSINNFSSPNYFLGYNFSMEGLFDFLKKYGDVKVLSNPKILTLNNQPAIINVGDQISYRYPTGEVVYASTGQPYTSSTYTIGSSFIGITLYVIPEITENDQIIMKINPVTSELLDDLNQSMTGVDRSLPPDIKVKQLTSIVKVKDGQKVLIGGLISKNYTNQHNKVPLLGDIPILGRLFHSTSKNQKRSELFILIVPKIVKENSMPAIDDLAIFRE